MRGALLRRSLHFATAAVLLAVPFGSWTLLRAVLLSGAVGAIGLETVRLRSRRVRDLLCRVAPAFRSDEADRPSGAMWLALGYGLAALFSPPAPAMGILVAAIADPVASWVGSAGTTAGAKTWRGSGAHFAVALSVLALVGVPWQGAVLAAGVGTGLERWSGPVNDNLIVAPGVAATVALLA